MGMVMVMGMAVIVVMAWWYIIWKGQHTTTLLKDHPKVISCRTVLYPTQMSNNESRETDLVVTVFVGELVDLGAKLVEVAVEREVGLHDVLALEVIFT